MTAVTLDQDWRKVAPADRLVTMPAFPMDGSIRTLGVAAVEWMRSNLVQPDGPRAGKPFVPSPDQVDFLLWFYALDAQARWLFNLGVRRLSKGKGKPLALDTPVPTPSGWADMASLQVGDEVFDQDGQRVTVRHVGPVLLDEPAYRVEFSDGDEFVAGAAHEWVVEDLRAKYAERVVETREMAAEVVTPWQSGAKRWRVAVPGPLDCDHVDLGMDPWLLGFWLGDGERGTSRLTVGRQDIDEIREILTIRKIPWTEQRGNGAAYRISAGTVRRGAPNLVRDALRSLGVLDRKRIPAVALRASERQRWELLRGLVDSDGHISRAGQLEVVSIHEDLADDVRELMASLGMRPTVTADRAQLDGVDHGARYRIRAAAPVGERVACLARKQKRADDYHGRVRTERAGRGVQGSLSRYRHVSAVDAAASVPMRCITVDGGVFLAGRSMIPTHNSPFAAALSLFEFLGPARLDHFDDRVIGGAVGQPVSMPLVQIVAAAESQPLSLDTSVLTSRGWSTVGSLEAGDRVFGSDGSLVEVVGATPTLLGERCFEVTFDDGQRVVASAGHGWTVERKTPHGDSYETVTVSTAGLEATKGRRDRLPVVPVRYEAEDGLPLDPYLMGLWLGDGATADAAIAFDYRLRDEYETILAPLLSPTECLVWRHQDGTNTGQVRIRRRPGVCPRGHDYGADATIRFVTKSGHPGCLTCRRERQTNRGIFDAHIPTMRERLREAGVLGNKHIPESYMRAAYADRLALLGGLVDSDGSIDRKGRATFTNRNLDLVEQVEELVAGLGHRVAVSAATGGARRVHWTPKSGEPFARLGHKVERLRTDRDHPLSRYRRIVSVRPVPSVPVRCVAVSAPDHLFQVGHGILTHNTKNTMRYVRAFCPKGGSLAKKYGIDVGKTQFYKLPEGTLEVITSSFTAAEGAQVTAAIGDEPEHWTPSNNGDDLNSTIVDNLTKTGGRMVHTCNAWKPGIGSVAEASWDDWVAQEEGKLRGDQRILYDARVAPPDTDMSDRDSLMAALEHCYAGSPWVDLENIIQRIWRKSAKPDDSKRKYLNRPTAPEDAWQDEDAWARLADPTVTVAPDDPVVAFFDGSKSRDATAIVCCRMSDGYVFVPKTRDGRPTIWEPDPSHDSDDAVDVADVDLAVTTMFEQHNVVAFFGDVQEWESFVKIDWPERLADKLKMMAVPQGKDPQHIAWDMRSHTFDFTRAAELVDAEINDDQFTHDGNPALARHVANMRRRPNRYGISVGKESPSSPKKIDAGVCMIGARMVRRIALAAGIKLTKPKPSRVVVLAD